MTDEKHPAPVMQLVIREVIQHGGTDDGKALAVLCTDQRGQRFNLVTPAALEVVLLSNLLAASSLCAERRGDSVTALDPETIDIGALPDGRLAARLAFSSGLEMLVALTDDQLGKLRQTLDHLDDHRRAGGPPRHM